MKVVIAGEMPFLDEIAELSTSAGISTDIYLIEDILDALHTDTILDNSTEADVIIEMHNESVSGKKKLLRALSLRVIPETIIISLVLTTSATQAASWVKNPQRFVGFGFLPPSSKNDLIEIAPALQTSKETLARAESFWKNLGLETVQVNDGPGLVRARIVCCFINEAVSALMEGVASAEDIDMAMRLGTNYPYGPLEWADHVGLDTVLGVMTGLFNEWGEDRYRPSPLLKRMVSAGFLGKKTGQGFFAYTSEDI